MHFSIEPRKDPSTACTLIIMAITVSRLDVRQRNRTRYAINIRNEKRGEKKRSFSNTARVRVKQKTPAAGHLQQPDGFTGRPRVCRVRV